VAPNYPHYEFQANKGYPCWRHKMALQAYGPCAIHRRTWVFMDSLSWDMRARRPGVAEDEDGGVAEAEDDVLAEDEDDALAEAEDDVPAEDKVGGLSEYEDGGEVVVE
jgi:hypothetical protein